MGTLSRELLVLCVVAVLTAATVPTLTEGHSLLAAAPGTASPPMPLAHPGQDMQRQREPSSVWPSIRGALPFEAPKQHLLTFSSPPNWTTIASVSAGREPEAVAYDSGKGEIFAGNYGSSNVSVISDSSASVSASVNVGTDPVALAYDSGLGEEFVVNDYSNNVSVISDSTNSVVATIPVTGGLSNKHCAAFDSAQGEVFFSRGALNEVSVISDASNSIVSTVAVGSEAAGCAYDSAKGEVFVSNFGSASVSVISDTSNTVVATIPLGAGVEPNAMSYDTAKGEIFVATCPSGGCNWGNVSVISDTTNSVVASIPVPWCPSCGDGDVAYDPADGEIFVGELGAQGVAVISDASNSMVATVFPPNPIPFGIAYDNGKREVAVTDESSKVSLLAARPGVASLTLSKRLLVGVGADYYNASTNFAGTSWTFSGTFGWGLSQPCVASFTPSCADRAVVPAPTTPSIDVGWENVTSAGVGWIHTNSVTLFDDTAMTALASTSLNGTAPHQAVTVAVSLTNGSGSNAYSWTLNGSAYPAGNTSTFSFSPAGAGDFSFHVSVTDSFGQVQSSRVILAVFPLTRALSATASASPTSGVEPLGVSFAGTASGGSVPYSWSWRFGDRGFSSLQNPTHTYTTPGAYDAWLWVNDSAGGHATSQVAVNVTPAGSSGGLAVVAFASPHLGPAPLFVQLYGSATGGSGSYSFEWLFGDGSGGSASASPGHTYSSAGHFNATLFANDTAGHTASTQVAISVTPPAGPMNGAQVAFVVDPASCGPILFNGTPEAGGVAWRYPLGSYAAWALSCNGYSFVDWSTTGKVTIQGSPSSGQTNITAQGNGTLWAFYVATNANRVFIQVAPARSDAVVFIAGQPYPDQGYASLADGSYPISAGAFGSLRFDQWSTSGSVSISGGNLTVSGGGAILASFISPAGPPPPLWDQTLFGVPLWLLLVMMGLVLLVVAMAIRRRRLVSDGVQPGPPPWASALVPEHPPPEYLRGVTAGPHADWDEGTGPSYGSFPVTAADIDTIAPLPGPPFAAGPEPAPHGPPLRVHGAGSRAGFAATTGPASSSRPVMDPRLFRPWTMKITPEGIRVEEVGRGKVTGSVIDAQFQTVPEPSPAQGAPPPSRAPSSQDAYAVLLALGHAPHTLDGIKQQVHLDDETLFAVLAGLLKAKLIARGIRQKDQQALFVLTPLGRRLAVRNLIGQVAEEIRSAPELPEGEKGSSSTREVRAGPPVPSLPQRVLLHLLAQPRLGNDEVAPVAYSQSGMATSLGKPQAAFAKALQRLETQGLVESDTRHVQGQLRRMKVYRLTALGENVAKELRKSDQSPPPTAHAPSPVVAPGASAPVTAGATQVPNWPASPLTALETSNISILRALAVTSGVPKEQFLVFTTDPPSGLPGLAGAEFRQISHQEGEGKMRPGELDQMADLIERHLSKGPGRRVIMEGVEMILESTNLKNVRRLLRVAREDAMLHQGRVLFAVNPKAHSQEELALLEEGARVVGGDAPR